MLVEDFKSLYFCCSS